MRVLRIVALVLSAIGVVAFLPGLIREIGRGGVGLLNLFVVATFGLSVAVLAIHSRGAVAPAAIRKLAVAANAFCAVAAGLALGGLFAGIVRPAGFVIALAVAFALTVVLNVYVILSAEPPGARPAEDTEPTALDRRLWYLYWLSGALLIVPIIALVAGVARGPAWAAAAAVPGVAASAVLLVFTRSFVRVYAGMASRQPWLRRRGLALIGIGGYDVGSFRATGILGLAVTAALVAWIGTG